MSTYELSENVFENWDGLKQFYRAWIPKAPSGKAIVLFHRGHEHSGRWESFVAELGLDDYSIFAWDARGNGKTEGPRDYAEHFSTYAKDADTFVRHLAQTHDIPVENMVAIGHSVGAAVVATWVHDFAPPLRGMVLAVPAFRIRLYMPLAIPMLRLGLAAKVLTTVPSYVKAKVLTHDAAEIAKMESDTLITHSISNNILLDLHDTSTRLIADAGAIHTPTLMLVAGKDWVVEKSAIRRFYERLGAWHKAIEEYPDFYHGVYHEKERALPIQRTRAFIEELFATEIPQPDLTQAHRIGFTKEEYDQLRLPLSWLSPKGAGYGIFKYLMGSVGKMSDGIRLGWESGFNSGRTLDYVYENEARGSNALGRLMDRAYLDGIGWRGIRVRRQNMRTVIEKYVKRLADSGTPVHVVDIAAGAGRYLLETLAQLDAVTFSAHLRDMEPKNLAAGKAIADTLGLTQVTFEEGNAFDGESLAALSPRPSLAIVSGLYELFSDNEQILASLSGLSAALLPGGYLIYTNQPWHPQVELIARLLCDWDGKPWIMRRRTQAEMDALVDAAGFEKLEMEIDQWGIFTVSVARKR